MTRLSGRETSCTSTQEWVSIETTGTGGADALVLHLHGTPGHRAEIVPIPAAPAS